MWEIVLSRVLDDPIRLYLLEGDVLATFAVGLGIIWETGPPDVRVVANRLVIGGIIAETLCSVLLFAYDANVIGSQNDKIIALETRLAPRHFSGEQKNGFIVQMTKFSGTKFAVASAGASEVADALKAAGWEWINWPLGG
jgi:hypothetical protein